MSKFPKDDIEILNLHSGAIQVENKLSLKARLCWFNMVYKAIPLMQNQDIFTVSIGDLKKAIDYKGTDNKNFKNVLEELRDTKIEWNIFEKNEPSWGWDHLLSGCRVRLNSNIIEYSFSPFLKEKLTNPEMYAKINLLISRNFKSKHSLAIYCLALDYLYIKNNQGEKNFSLEEIRKYLGLEKNELKKPGDLNIWVIQKAVSDINSNSDMNISIDIRRGERSKILGFKLKMSIKEEYLNSYKPQKLITQNKKIQTNLFDIPIEEPKMVLESIKQESKAEIIKVDRQVLKEFFAENKISITTKTVQDKLKEIKEKFQDKFEDYLIFLVNYTKQESKKSNINNISGFYVGLLKDENQFDNYLIEFQSKEKERKNQQTKINYFVDNELKKKYEIYLLKDFESYLMKNVNKLEKKIIEIIKSTAKAGEFFYDLVLSKHNNGLVDKTLLTETKAGTKGAVINHLIDYKDKLGYKSLEFEDWKDKEITQEEIRELEIGFEKSLF